MAITALPTLDRTSATFKADTDTFFGSQLPAFAAEANALQEDVNTKQAAASAAAATATTQASNAALSAAAASAAAAIAGAVLWVSGTTYAAGFVVYSPSNYQIYRRKGAGAGSTDPSLDPTNWAQAAIGEVTLIGAETLLNKRISVFYLLDRTTTNATATGALTIDASTASVFNLTLSGNVSGITVSNAPTLSGETLSFVVKVTQGATAYSLTWFTGIAWLTIGGVAPAAPAANKTVEYIFTSTLAGVYFGRKGAAT